MAIFQIIYLVINIIGTLISLVWFIGEIDCPIISALFDAVAKCCGNLGVTLVGILLVLLFIPTISFMTILGLLIMLIGTCFDGKRSDE